MFVREIAPSADAGDAPTIVLLHGWTLSADLNWFSGVYDVAARHGRVLAPDLRGHGRGLRSDEPFTLDAVADDVIGLIRSCDANRAILVGYSLGGSVALLCAARAPELVEGLVLASTDLQWRDGLRDHVEWFVLGLAEYVLRFGVPRGVSDRYLRHAVERSPALQPYLGWVKAEARRGDASAIGNAAKSLARFDGHDLAERLDVPTAVVVTTRDHLVAPRRQRAVAKALDAPMIEVAGAHNAWLVCPDDWAAAVDEAIGRVSTRASATRHDPTLRGQERPLEEVRSAPA
jgi:pimeloyl-ACP methyl ester carboxylesterase